MTHKSIGLGIREGEEAPAGAGRAPGRREAEELLQVGPDAHGAEEVEEGHGAVRGVGPWDAAVAHLVDEGDGLEGQLGDGAALEHGVEHAEDDEEDERDDPAGLELGEGEVAGGLLEAGLDPVHLLGAAGAAAAAAGLLGGGRVAEGPFLHGVELLGGLVYGGAEGLVGGGAVEEEQVDLSRPRRVHRDLGEGLLRCCQGERPRRLPLLPRELALQGYGQTYESSCETTYRDAFPENPCREKPLLN